VDWKDESGQLNIVHNQKLHKEEAKTNQRQGPISPVQVQDP